VALTKMNKKQNTQVFNPKIIAWILNIESLLNNSTKLYPPKNNIAVIQLNKTIEEYSPRKKKTKIIDEWSVLNPETNSDSKIGLV
jgi:hypothetical protein